MLNQQIQIIAHRGHWDSPTEKNSFTALKRALDSGLGIETDLRDLNGEIVVSHDPPSGELLTARSLFEYYVAQDCPGLLALNIKSDGLQASLKELIEDIGVTSYVCFDMSVPDSLGYIRSDLPILARISDLEPVNLLLDRAEGVWLDELEIPWLNQTTLEHWFAHPGQIHIVSPELHKRDHIPLWQNIKRTLPERSPAAQIFLCTDHVSEAREFFV